MLNRIILIYFRHLARNPFHCDCYINWIVDWLARYPVETSGARCEGPKRMHKKKLGSLRAEQLKCYGKIITEHWLFLDTYLYNCLSRNMH